MHDPAHALLMAYAFVFANQNNRSHHTQQLIYMFFAFHCSVKIPVHIFIVPENGKKFAQKSPGNSGAFDNSSLKNEVCKLKQ